MALPLRLEGCLGIANLQGHNLWHTSVFEVADNCGDSLAHCGDSLAQFGRQETQKAQKWTACRAVAWRRLKAHSTGWGWAAFTATGSAQGVVVAMMRDIPAHYHGLWHYRLWPKNGVATAF
jgi:hypothetical protein